MGPGQKFLTQVGSAISGLGLENFLYKSQFFHSDKKIASRRVKKYLGQMWVSLLSTMGQKHPRVGSVAISRIKTDEVCI